MTVFCLKLFPKLCGPYWERILQSIVATCCQLFPTKVGAGYNKLTAVVGRTDSICDGWGSSVDLGQLITLSVHLCVYSVQHDARETSIWLATAVTYWKFWAPVLSSEQMRVWRSSVLLVGATIECWISKCEEMLDFHLAGATRCTNGHDVLKNMSTVQQ